MRWSDTFSTESHGTRETVYTLGEYIARLNLTCWNHLGTCVGDAYRMLDRGALRGTVIEVELRMSRHLLGPLWERILERYRRSQNAMRRCGGWA